MNKRTKILFIIYLIIAPVVYFISSAHTPHQHHKVEQFTNIHSSKTKYTVIAFISDDANQYQQALTKALKGKDVKLMCFLTNRQENEVSNANFDKQNTYINNSYFVKAGIKIDETAPSLQLFIVNKKQKLVFQEQYHHPSTLRSSQLFSHLKKS